VEGEGERALLGSHKPQATRHNARDNIILYLVATSLVNKRDRRSGEQ
jgi:hypothetical protein